MNRKYLNYLIRERKIVLIFFFILYAGISMTPYLQGNVAGIGGISWRTGSEKA